MSDPRAPSPATRPRATRRSSVEGAGSTTAGPLLRCSRAPSPATSQPWAGAGESTMRLTRFRSARDTECQGRSSRMDATLPPRALPVIDGGYNVDTGSTCVNPAAPATGSRFNTPAGLDPAGLAANGGPTRTIALVAASAAIGLIPNGTVGSCPRTDQRGTASVAGAPCDAGAFQTVSVVCAAGSYSATGSSPCTLAAPGFFVASACATLATPCPLGAFQDQAGQSSCIPAPIGFYVSQVAAVAATACPPGTTTSVDGATSMGSCVAVVPAPDSVPPLVTGLVTPAANADGWNNTTVIVDRTAVDPAPSGPGIGPTRHHGVDRGCEPDHHF